MTVRCDVKVRQGMTAKGSMMNMTALRLSLSMVTVEMSVNQATRRVGPMANSRVTTRIFHWAHFRFRNP